ncbi:MAG: hypothetical protein O6952_04040 [Planctomycetota bacterium]|nr:hypothetical protein [Planctomycetota bacterium]
MQLDPSDPTRWLPHRKPFLFLDRIAHVVPGREATAWKRIVDSECRGVAQWPRAYLVEMMAQTSAILLFSEEEGRRGRMGVLAAVPALSFRRSACPGETVVATARLEKRWGNLARFKVAAHVEGELAAEGALVLAAREGVI